MAERRRSLWPVALLGLGSAALAAVASSRPWGAAHVVLAGDVRRVIEAKGTDVAPLAAALGWVALAAWGTVLVLRGRPRRAMAAVGFLASAGLLVTVAAKAHTVGDVANRLAGDFDTSTPSYSAWLVVALASSAVAVASFAAAWWLAPSWPEMNARYDAPGTQAREPDQTDLWKAMDEGRDPTA